ncbi:MAG: single-stranded DNA-binding protein [Microscillaceae bacterium]|jgi:single-strand DNA-binding protein|nr:single-stranded DNA-binding protein [Microscillaceae bacterium]
MKQLQIIGNLGQDAILRDYQGKKFCTFTVAIDESYKDANGVKTKKTDWISCTTEKTNLAKFLTKGTKIFAEGNCKAESYQDKEGKTRVQLKMSCYKIELLGSPDKPETSQAPTQAQNQTTENGNQDDFPF